jgi:hypothetical protein
MALVGVSVTGENSTVLSMSSTVTEVRGWSGQRGCANAGVLVTHWG